jgi:plastocyanin
MVIAYMRKVTLYVFFLPWLAFGAAAADIPIDQKHQQFLPGDAVLKAGDVLVITNHDNMNHNIQVVNADGDAEDKGLQRPGEIVKHAFPNPGNFQVRCTIHPEMILTIIVK